MADDDPVAVVRELYVAFDTGDRDGIRRGLAEGVRWRQAGTAVPAAGEELEGVEAVLDRVVGALEADWDGFTEEVDEMIADDAHVVVTGTYRGHHQRTGRELAAEYCHIWRVADGQVVAFRQFADTAAYASASAADDVPRSG